MRRVGYIKWMVWGVGTLAFSTYAADLAKVNGRPITDRDLQLTLGSLQPGQKEAILRDSHSKSEIVKNLIDQEILAQEAEKLKLDQEVEFKDTLSYLKKQLLVAKILERNLSSKMTEKAAKDYYDLHKTKYTTDQIHVLHILLKNEKAAKDMLAKVKMPNNDFQALAEQYSADPNAKNNRGDLGMVSRSELVRPFAEAAFRAKEGEIVGPVKTQFGFHVIKVLEKKMGRTLNYDEVEMQVKNDLKQDLAQSYVESLKQKNNTRIE